MEGGNIESALNVAFSIARLLLITILTRAFSINIFLSFETFTCLPDENVAYSGCQ